MSQRKCNVLSQATYTSTAKSTYKRVLVNKKIFYKYSHVIGYHYIIKKNHFKETRDFV